MARVLLALSGGVDSSAAAVLLQKQGYEVVAVTMRLLPAGLVNNCQNEEDIEIAGEICEFLGIEHKVVDLSQDFEAKVIRPFVEAYESALTPNPCVDCNRTMKFDSLYEIAIEMGCDYIASGHYARVEYSEELDRHLLKKALDPDKDQSYVLYNLTKEKLAHTIFPLGSLTKDEARRIVQEAGLPNYAKSESMDICFIPEGDYVSFLEDYRGEKYEPGNFVNLEGKVLGQHKGLVAYTIGQRKGLGLSHTEPLFVLKLRPASNEIVVVEKKDLFHTGLIADRINLIAIDEIPDGGAIYQVRTRYQQKEIPVRIRQISEDRLELEFIYEDESDRRIVAPGQSLVIYDGDVVVGGGRIIEAIR